MQTRTHLRDEEEDLSRSRIIILWFGNFQKVDKTLAVYNYHRSGSSRLVWGSHPCQARTESRKKI